MIITKERIFMLPGEDITDGRICYSRMAERISLEQNIDNRELLVNVSPVWIFRNKENETKFKRIFFAERFPANKQDLLFLRQVLSVFQNKNIANIYQLYQSYGTYKHFPSLSYLKEADLEKLDDYLLVNEQEEYNKLVKVYTNKCPVIVSQNMNFGIPINEHDLNLLRSLGRRIR